MSGYHTLPTTRHLPQELGDKGKMAADPTHKMMPSRWPHGFKDKGKMVSVSSLKLWSPVDHVVWETKGKKMADKKYPHWKARAYRAVLVVDEDLPRCMWRQRCPPLSPVGCHWCWCWCVPWCRSHGGGNGFVGTCVGWPSPWDQLKLCCWWDLQSSFWKQFLVVKCSFSKWLQLQAEKPG